MSIEYKEQIQELYDLITYNFPDGTGLQFFTDNLLDIELDGEIVTLENSQGQYHIRMSNVTYAFSRFRKERRYE